MGEAFWSTQALDWTAEQTRLITHTQSLTVYLQQTQLPVRVQVLYSGAGTMTASEQAASQWPDKQAIFIREVLLRLNEMPVILARSICQLPLAHANHTDPNHFWLNLLNRGNHPLGLNLFHPEGQIQACTLHYAPILRPRRTKFSDTKSITCPLPLF
jgi:chorismate-pyruvate lyase